MRERLTEVELDFLWESGNLGELPYPITVRSHGDTLEERAALRARVLTELASRGLVDGDGRPQPHVEDTLGVLAAAELSLDSVFIGAPGAQPRMAVAAAVGEHGVLLVQEAGTVWLERVPADGLVSAIVGQLPPAERGREQSITVPLEQLLAGPGADFMQRRPATSDGSTARADSDRKALARLHAQNRERGGQLGANARNRSGAKGRSPVLSWFDTETGRYLTQASRGSDGRDWIVIAPADAPTLRHRLSEMVSSAAEATTARL
ncbi:ESX secretion-associated protein EspG [Saccharomonospora piscinae]|uniref:ESX secretion-associated protein EspG n=1 Tax=Saccharomonospora piscinae TaxID=687388 RepID=A0A1V9A6V4_SACPI|nr:ESX secretion-associated protein EspG [Saccharomonospora piscinae]OQO92842.1 ESX secretion-associated protein EspG [Saccharomonospora piscinae]TLW92979.1 ESX secretion-associated protein EspG [Saccharomonospora piscinae]